MSIDNVRKMFAIIEKDQNFQKKYADLITCHGRETEKTLADKLVEFGRTENFNFTNDDLMAARAELADKLNSNGELNEKDLTNVSGGGIVKSCAVAFSIVTFGASCAVFSIYYEINQRLGRNVSCASCMTTKNEECKNY